MERRTDKKPRARWKRIVYNTIFHTNTRIGRIFDEVLLISIIVSVIAVFLDSVSSLHDKYGNELLIAEWFFTILFTAEYLLRIISSPKPLKYIFSFYGIIDLLAILPTYFSLIFAGSQYLLVIRILRLMRIFRILKLNRYVGASGILWESIKNARYKIMVFLWGVLTMVVIMGAIMYLVEGPQNGFRSIPESIYWAIVTLTTVGYGDISPQTVLGKVIASIIMITGYAVIAVPTGIMSVEIFRSKDDKKKEKQCDNCGTYHHDDDANFCKKCGKELVEKTGYGG